MQYGTQKSTGPFRLSIRLDAEPRCPGCAEYLQPCVIEFRNGWAWCQPCIAMGLHAEPWIASVLEGASMQACRIVVNGLSFYVPSLTYDETKTAYEWYEASAGGKVLSSTVKDPDGLYLRVPGGVAPIADLDLTELRELDAMLRSRHRSDAPGISDAEDDDVALTSEGEQVLLDLDA